MEKDSRRCPFCGEEIKAIAKKCRHCGQWLIKECPHCHRWIKATSQKCRYCKQWVDEEDEPVYEYTEEKESFFHKILEIGGNGCASCLGRIIAIIFICFVAHILLPSDNTHIEKAKTEIAESMSNDYAKKGVRWGQLVIFNGSFLMYGPNFDQSVKKALEEKYTFKVYDLIVFSFCDIIDKETNEESTISVAAFGMVFVLAKTKAISIN